jgi:hypothetical protein
MIEEIRVAVEIVIHIIAWVGRQGDNFTRVDFHDGNRARLRVMPDTSVAGGDLMNPPFERHLRQLLNIAVDV